MKKNIIIILSVLLIISIIGNVFLYIKNNDTALSLQKGTKELSTIQATLSEKESELSEANTVITELEGSITDLQNQITDFEKQLKELKDKLAQAEKEKAEREEDEKKEAEEQAVEEIKPAPSTPNPEDIIIVPGEIPGEVIGDNPFVDGGEYDNSPGSGNYAGVTIY